MRCKSELPLLNDKVESVNICVNINIDLKFRPKVVWSRRFPLSKSICKDWHTIVMKEARMKTPNDIMYVLIEYNLFLKSTRQIKYFPVMIYMQEYISDSGEIQKKSLFKWLLFVIHKLMNKYCYNLSYVQGISAKQIISTFTYSWLLNFCWWWRVSEIYGVILTNVTLNE